MELAFYLFVLLIVLAAALANISIWSPRKLWVKVCALAVTAAFIPLGYAGLTELLSRPKPVSLEWARRHVPEAKLMAASVREGVAIFLWLQVPEAAEPRAYELPWNRELAQQLQDAQREAKKHRNGVRVRRPFDRDTDKSKRMFYAEPQRPDPLKQPPDDGPLNFTPQSRGS